MLVPLPALLPTEEPKLSPAEERERIISIALNTPEGRAALAAAMTEPFVVSLKYQSIGRKLLTVEELPG
jgi:hypothetical protein